MLLAKRNFRKQEAAELVDTLLDIIKDTLESGEDVNMSGFGKFVVHQKHDRRGRNTQNGESITITARKVLTFKPSIFLKQAINGD